jgi:hypothetical protein
MKITLPNIYDEPHHHHSLLSYTSLRTRCDTLQLPPLRSPPPPLLLPPRAPPSASVAPPTATTTTMTT